MKTISSKELIEKGIAEDNRTIRQNIQKGWLPVPIKKEKELLFDKKELLTQFKVKDLNSFVDLSKAAKILKIKKETVLKLTEQELLPSYKLWYNGKEKYLFRKEELENIDNKVFIKKSEGFIYKRNGDAYIQRLIAKVLDLPSNKFKLSTAQITILKATLEEGASLESILNKIKETSFRNFSTRLKSAMRTLMISMHEISIEQDQIVVERQNNELLRKENKLYKQLITELAKEGIKTDSLPVLEIRDKLLNVPVENTGLSDRTKHYLLNENITNLKQLENKSKKELVRIEHFGKKTLAEIMEEFQKRGMNLN